MKIATRTIVPAMSLLLAIHLQAQAPKPAPQVPAPAVQPAQPAPSLEKAADPTLDEAQNLIGKALFLRGFYAANELAYNNTGHLTGEQKDLKTTDWTLAAVDIQKAERKASTIELNGIRVAIRYNADQHTFERHPQKDEKIRITLAAPGDPKALASAEKTIFSAGIDPAFQRSMPDFWQHYFIPTAPWPADDLAGKTIVNASTTLPPRSTEPIPDRKVQPKFTTSAEHDRVKGTVQIRLVVDEQGEPRHIAVLTPIGYGLDERTIEAVRTWRFHPATRAEKPVPANVVIDQAFDFIAPPKP